MRCDTLNGIYMHIICEDIHKKLRNIIIIFHSMYSSDEAFTWARDSWRWRRRHFKLSDEWCAIVVHILLLFLCILYVYSVWLYYCYFSRLHIQFADASATTTILDCFGSTLASIPIHCSFCFWLSFYCALLYKTISSYLCIMTER